MKSHVCFPRSVDGLSNEILTDALQDLQPGIEVLAYEILRVEQCGEGAASTADQVFLNLRYGGVVPEGIPRQVLLKTMLISAHAPPEMYENEVVFYRDIRPDLTLETPRVFASEFDRSSGHFGVIMEDLTQRSAFFPNASHDISVQQIKSILRTLATLHGSFWQSQRLTSDLQKIATPVAGGMSNIFRQHGYELVADQVSQHPFKQALISPLGLSLEDMWDRLCLFQDETLQEPQTLLHGDTHIANTYLLPDDKGGLYDWQLMVRGNWAHDVSYLIATGLTAELRRQHGKALLQYYLDLLREQNLPNLPDPDQAWYLYRRSIMWGLFVGWLITPPANYGETITAANISRLVAAVIDMDSFNR
jgi:aminoglycoside/choline kinase family phosphotransferase